MSDAWKSLLGRAPGCLALLFVAVLALNFVFVRSDDPQVPLAATDRRARAMNIPDSSP